MFLHFTGVVRFWSMKEGKCVHSLSVTDKCDEEQHILHMSLCSGRGLLSVVTYHHNILLYDLKTLKLYKQLMGYNDDILDMSFAGSHDNFIAVATNSNQLKLYRMDTMDCRILSGHSGTILAVDVSSDGQKIVTGSKDNGVCLWSMDAEGHFQLSGVGKGHTHAVSTVACSRSGDNFVISGSQDLTVKIWSIPKLNKECVSNMVVKLTEKVHDKDVNSVTVSPNDKLFATGSQDKTAKVWQIKDGALLGTLRGHKRGVWCVQFSPVDQCIASASGDSTIKIWALSDMTCIKTFEGHNSSVLKVIFLSRGMQLMSSGSDGLVKLWTIKTNECIKTFDQHSDKVWCIATNKNEDVLVSGGGDSVINIWKDVTKEEQQQAYQEKENKILMEQKLSNLLHNKKFTLAIGLAITLDQPYKLLNIFKDILASEGVAELTNTIKELRDDQTDSVLKYIAGWNTNARNTFTSQTVLSVILKTKSPYDLVERQDIKDKIEALLPYTERHLKRMDRLLQQSEFLEYTWQRMKLSEQKEATSDEDGKSEIITEDEQRSNKQANQDQNGCHSNTTGDNDDHDDNDDDEDFNNNDDQLQQATTDVATSGQCAEPLSSDITDRQRTNATEQFTTESKTDKNKAAKDKVLKRKLKTLDETEQPSHKTPTSQKRKDFSAKKKLKGWRKIQTVT